jgi:GntR family transcriptional regulator
MLRNASQAPIEPLHHQLKRVILEHVTDGKWPPSTQIPSEREMCEQYGISRTTARRAIADLIHEGQLYTITGKGTFVAERPLKQKLEPFVGFSQDLAGQLIEVKTKVLESGRVEADERLAKQLGLRPLSPVLKLRRLRLGAGQPIALQTAFLPEHLCPGLLRFDFVRDSLFLTLRDEYGLELVRGFTTIKAGLASKQERTLLALNNPSAVLRTFQTTHLSDGQIIEYCESIFHGEHFELTSTAWKDRVIGELG